MFSGLDGSILFTFDGNSDGDLLGRSVNGAGDLNGDGLEDVILGALRGGANGGGYAQVFLSQGVPAFLLGDANRDGVVNFLEIAPFITLLSSNAFQVEADINGDQGVNFLDIPPFIAIQSSF